MSRFDPNVNYANPKTDMETLKETVNAMCNMWSEIAKEMNCKEGEKSKKQRKTPVPVVAPTKYYLPPEEVQEIIDTNMGDDHECEEEFEESEPVTITTAYDNMFEG